MKKKYYFIPLIVFYYILLSNTLFAQQDFYYSKGEKIPLEISTQKISIKFKNGITEDQIQQFLSKEPILGEIKPIRPAIARGFHTISLNEITDVKHLVQRLKNETEVEIVNPVYLIRGLHEIIPFDIFIVQFKPWVTQIKIEELNKQHNVEIVKTSTASPNLYTLRVASQSDLPVLEMANEYYETLLTEYSLPDFIIKAELLTNPNDTYFQYQYYFHNTGQTGGVDDADIDALEAWEITTGSSQCTVAIIDQGGTFHEDLPSSRIVPGYDFYYDDNDPSPGGNEAHGMACAGIIGASQNNSKGIAGLIPECKIMNIRIFNEYGQTTSNSNIAEAIDFAWQNDASVISNSWGFALPGYWDDNIAAAINRAFTQGRGGKGSVVVCAAGNTADRENDDYGYVMFPASVSGVLSVGATDKSNNIQNYSPRTFFNLDVDIVAPSGDKGYLLGSKLIEFKGDVWSLDMSGQPGYNPGDYGIDPPTEYIHYIWDYPGGDSYPPGNYTAKFGGTSAACPQVAGVSALILSLNNNLYATLNNPQVQDIIKKTADDMGPEGEDNDFGHGRVNAYQALLSGLAYANKSISSSATAYNNGRRLNRDSGNHYHLVFGSGGETFYRKSTAGGASWEEPIRLSEGNNNNKFPSICYSKYAVWQRYKGYSYGEYKYDIYFAKSHFWIPTKIDNISNLNFSNQTDPLPVIAYKTRSGGYRLIVCVKTNSAIKYVTSDNYGTSWSSANIVPATLASHHNPSLSMGPTTPANTVYLTYDNGSTIYLNSYTDSWGTSYSVPAGTATINSKNASVEVDGDNGINVAWEGKKRFGNKQIIFHRRKYNGSWQTATYFESSSANYYRPSISGHDSNKRTVVWYSDGGAVYHAYYNGSAWSEFGGMTDTWLQHANISTGTTTAKFVSTGGLTSPYTIYLSSETFPPSGGLSKIASGNSVTDGDLILTPLNVIYHRSASLQTDNEESSFWLELGEIAVNESKDNFTSVDFIPLDEKSLNVTVTNIFDHLQSDPFEFATDAQTIEWMQKVYLHRIEKLLYQGKSEIIIKIFLNDDNTKSPLTILNESYIPVSVADSLIELKVQKDIKDYQGRKVFLSVLVEGVDGDNAEIVAELGHNYLIQDEKLLKKSIQEKQGDQYTNNQVPSQFKLDQNYPNPFNASTVIQYHLTNESHVELAIYNLIGQKICTIQNEHKQPGYHSVTWDGIDDNGAVVSSGIYIYVVKTDRFRDVKKMILLR